MTRLNFAFLFFRVMTRHCRIPCLRLCALGISRMRSNFVVMRTNHGAPRAFADLLSSRGLRFVSSPFLAIAACFYDLTLKYATSSVSHSAAIRWCGRRRGRRSRPLVREQAARIMEDSLHARRSRFPPVVHRARFIRRARAVRPDLNRPQVLLSLLGRRALGDDFCFVRRATERGTRTVGWGILGPVRERARGRRCG